MSATAHAARLKRAARGAALPFTVVNMAMTADGKIATSNRRVSSFSSRADGQHLLALRATADAVMAGARTVDAMKVNLGPGATRFRRRRKAAGLAEYNLRLIVSRSGSIDPNAEIFRHRFSPIIILCSRLAGRDRVRRLRALADEVRVCGRDAIDFRREFRWLRSKWGIRRLVCEGGGQLNDALFRAGVIDELHLTVCPKLFGGRHAPTISDDLGVRRLRDATRLELKSMKRLKDELFLVYRVLRPPRSRGVAEIAAKGRRNHPGHR